MSKDKIPDAWRAARGTDQFVMCSEMPGLDLRDQDLSDIRVENLVANGADFRQAIMEDFRCIGGELVGARFDGAFLARAMFFDIVLSESRFDNARMLSCSLAGCIVRDASFTFVELHGADLLGVDLGGADLSDAELNGVNARSAIFRDANLTNADMSGGDFTNASFIGANLEGVIWDDAILEGARFAPGTDPRE
jgi:uncharacterized protein YjbI with pentapeptide repeats